MVEVKEIFIGALRARIDKEAPMRHARICNECYVHGYGATAQDAWLNVKHALSCNYALTVAIDNARRLRMSFAVWEQELIEAGKL